MESKNKIFYLLKLLVDLKVEPSEWSRLSAIFEQFLKADKIGKAEIIKIIKKIEK